MPWHQLRGMRVSWLLGRKEINELEELIKKPMPTIYIPVPVEASLSKFLNVNEVTAEVTEVEIDLTKNTLIGLPILKRKVWSFIGFEVTV